MTHDQEKPHKFRHDRVEDAMWEDFMLESSGNAPPSVAIIAALAFVCGIVVGTILALIGGWLF